ncbi:uncharacterized protein [Hetaerina americana]|uniref:uncharacterized protein n=1 Tax=Hetaerina americana TaxID=62018 RepID=UPI003A7F13DF
MRYQLDRVSQELYRLHLELSCILNKEDWETIDNITNILSTKNFTSSKETQTKKFNKLHQVQHPSTPGPEKDPVLINLTNQTLSEDIASILTKGLNFAIAPKEIPKENIIIGVEDAVRKLPKHLANEIREDVSQILRKAKPPRPNITAAERKALEKLRDNKELLVLPADKGNATNLRSTPYWNRRLAEGEDQPEGSGVRALGYITRRFTAFIRFALLRASDTAIALLRV